MDRSPVKLDKATLDYTLCELDPGSQVTCSISVGNNAGWSSNVTATATLQNCTGNFLLHSPTELHSYNPTILKKI